MSRLGTLAITFLLACSSFVFAQTSPVASEEAIRPPQADPRTQLPPEYPPAARKARIQGSVTVKVTVRVDGSIAATEVVECTHRNVGFEQAALDAVRKWKFEPALQGTQPVEEAATFRLNFFLDASANPRVEVGAQPRGSGSSGRSRSGG